MKTLLRGKYVIGFDGKQHEVIQNGSVVFENDHIVFVGKEYAGAVDRTIDAPGSLISPGFINSHVHTGSNAGCECRNKGSQCGGVKGSQSRC